MAFCSAGSLQIVWVYPVPNVVILSAAEGGVEESPPEDTFQPVVMNPQPLTSGHPELVEGSLD